MSLKKCVKGHCTNMIDSDDKANYNERGKLCKICVDCRKKCGFGQGRHFTVYKDQPAEIELGDLDRLIDKNFFQIEGMLF